MDTPHRRAEIVVDLDRIRHNVRRLREWTTSADGTRPRMMTVVKADGYGHGLVPAARAAREGGADWLGVATVEEAVAVRDGGDRGPLLCWLAAPGDDHRPAVARDVDVTAYTVAQLDEVLAAGRALGRVPRVQLKVDTGLSRGGASPTHWPALVAAAREAERRGEARVTGIWSHLAASDEPEDPANAAQEQAFTEALAVAEQAGLAPEVRHLANSAAAVLRPSSYFDLVRCGIASYGQDPAPGHTPAALGLVPAMTVQARLVMTKRIEAGDGVSYGHTWVADRPTTLGLVPAGYGDGVPRHASSVVDVWVAGRRRPVRGRICMDQFIVDLGDDQIEAGEPVVLFGAGLEGGPTATDWALATGTINYEIVTRIGGQRLPRRYVDGGVAG